MNKFFIHTLGCRVNQYESRGIYESLVLHGYEPVSSSEDADIVIVNTCAVTAESGRKSAQMIRKYKKEGKKTVAIGCYSEMESEKCGGVFHVGGTSGKQNVLAILQGKTPISEKTEFEETPIGFLPIENRSRAYIKIEDGCNGKCSYCIIPKLRGEVRTRSEENIASELERISKSGTKEVVLTGIEVSAYKGLERLVEIVDSLDGIERLRFGSLDPRSLTESFLACLKNSKKFLPHLHISLQSGCSRILNLMKRPYNKEQAEKLLDRAVSMIPGLMLSCDIITSFPSETEQELDETLSFIEKYPFVHVHAFPFSARKGTVAAEMKETLTPSEKRRINKSFIEKCDNHRELLLEKMIGKTTKVLVEKKVNNTCFGNTDEYVELSFVGENYNKNEIVTVEIIKKENGKLVGAPVENRNEKQ